MHKHINKIGKSIYDFVSIIHNMVIVFKLQYFSYYLIYIPLDFSKDLSRVVLFYFVFPCREQEKIEDDLHS